MPKPCSICEHPERESIENALLLEKKTGHRICEQFGLSETQFSRHKAHIVRKADAALSKDQSESALGRLYQLAMQEYNESQDPKVRVAAIGRMQSIAVDMQRTIGAENTDPSAWADHPANASILDVIMVALEQHPKALEDVLRCLKDTLGTPLTRGVPAPNQQGGAAVRPPSEADPFSIATNTSANTDATARNMSTEE